MQEDWWSLYLQVLDHLKQKNTYFASMREIGQWWKKIQTLIDKPKKLKGINYDQ